MMGLLAVIKVKSHPASSELHGQSAVFCYGGKCMTPASMTELIQSRQQVWACFVNLKSWFVQIPPAMKYF